MASGKKIMRRMLALANAFLVFRLFRDRNETSNDDGHLDSIFIRLNDLQIGVRGRLRVRVLGSEHVHFEKFRPSSLKRMLSTVNSYS